MKMVANPDQQFGYTGRVGSIPRQDHSPGIRENRPLESTSRLNGHVLEVSFPRQSMRGNRHIPPDLSNMRLKESGSEVRCPRHLIRDDLLAYLDIKVDPDRAESHPLDGASISKNTKQRSRATIRKFLNGTVPKPKTASAIDSSTTRTDTAQKKAPTPMRSNESAPKRRKNLEISEKTGGADEKEIPVDG